MLMIMKHHENCVIYGERSNGVDVIILINLGGQNFLASFLTSNNYFAVCVHSEALRCLFVCANILSAA